MVSRPLLRPYTAAKMKPTAKLPEELANRTRATNSSPSDSLPTCAGCNRLAKNSSRTRPVTCIGTDVFIGAMGNGASNFAGVMDNTEVFGLIKKSLGL